MMQIMRVLTRDQKKSLSDFFHTLAAAWFTAGIIAPVFTQSFLSARNVLLGMVAAFFTMAFLAISLYTVKRGG